MTTRASRTTTTATAGLGISDKVAVGAPVRGKARIRRGCAYQMRLHTGAPRWWDWLPEHMAFNNQRVVPPTYLATLGSGALHERELVSNARPVRPATKANRIK